MLRTGIVCLVVCLLAPNVAWAGKASDLMAQINDKKTELGVAIAEEDRLTVENEKDFKAYKAYSDNHAQLEKQAQGVVDAFKAATAKQETYRNGLVDNWNNECSQDRVGALEEAAYNRCQSLKGEVQRIVDGIDADIERQRKDAMAQLQPIVDAGTRQENEMAAIDARMKARFAAWQKAKEVETRVRGDLDRLRAELARACADQPTPEDAKYCASIGWDGTSQSLAPLTEVKPSSSISPNN